MRQDPPCVGDSLKGIGVSVVFFRFAVRFCSISGGILSLNGLRSPPTRLAWHGSAATSSPISRCTCSSATTTANRRLPAWLAEAAAAHHCARYAAESQIAPATVNGSPAQAAHLYFLSYDAAPPPNSLLPSGASYANASTCSGLLGRRHRVGDCRPGILLPPRWGILGQQLRRAKLYGLRQGHDRRRGNAFRLPGASTAASTVRWRPKPGVISTFTRRPARPT